MYVGSGAIFVFVNKPLVAHHYFDISSKGYGVEIVEIIIIWPTIGLFTRIQIHICGHFKNGRHSKNQYYYLVTSCSLQVTMLLAQVQFLTIPFVCPPLCLCPDHPPPFYLIHTHQLINF